MSRMECPRYRAEPWSRTTSFGLEDQCATVSLAPLVAGPVGPDFANYLAALTESAVLQVSQAFTAVLSDTFVVSVTTVVLSPVVGVVVVEPPQDVNTAARKLIATNVTFVMLFVFKI